MFFFFISTNLYLYNCPIVHNVWLGTLLFPIPITIYIFKSNTKTESTTSTICVSQHPKLVSLFWSKNRAGQFVCTWWKVVALNSFFSDLHDYHQSFHKFLGWFLKYFFIFVSNDQLFSYFLTFKCFLLIILVF